MSESKCSMTYKTKRQHSLLLFKIGIVLEVMLLLLVISSRTSPDVLSTWSIPLFQNYAKGIQDKDYIKYAEFNVSYNALCLAYEYDVNSHGQKQPLDWITLLAYAAAHTGGEFPKKSLSYIDKAATRLQQGETKESLVKGLKYYSYYEKVYSAVLGNMLGVQKKQQADGAIKEEYGLTVFSPIAKGFDYSSYDDFGSSRSYGYRRPHLGHDMMGLIGTPIIAVEGGTVEALGWNQYGGWRIGIRSKDQKRYYYYAHLRQNWPYAEDLSEGCQVEAGQVIGYMGHTGYSTKENTNNIQKVHLHFGLELIFHESQKESDNEIWVDCYALTEFLKKNRSTVIRDETTKEWHAISSFPTKD